MYRERLEQQADEQIDAWVSELMRDLAKRKGIVGVIEAFRRASGLSDRDFERVFASGGGPPASVGRDTAGHLIVPAVSLWTIPAGLRVEFPDARQRLIDYLVASFHEIVFI
jgi:hypothetical protein